jgi:Bifunctional DNA primase/polymerase, N-terminal/AAA domain/Primase C terminal 1 (PriCT-1)
MTTLPPDIVNLASEGRRLFPVHSRGKTPLLKEWQHRASAKVDQLTAWHQHYRGCNWGMATGPMSGTWILDLDGEQASRFFLDLKANSGDDRWTNTRAVKTAKGRHVWFKYPAVPIGNSVGQISQGVDVRGDGGFVVIPPSEHESGVHYSWLTPADAPVLPAPDVLLNLLAKPKQVSPPNGTGKTRITQGERNTRLTQVAGAMRHYGMEPDAIYAALALHNATYCEPPLSEHEVRTISRSVSKYPPGTNEGTKSACELIVVRGDETVEKSMRWMWKPYLPLGKLIHFGGNSSQAKSPVTVDLAARISTGAAWPDGAVNTQGPRSIILLNIEDDLEDTILPRFRVAGGDKSRLYYVKGTRVALSKSDSLERLVTLEADMQNLIKLARSLPELAVIIIDPVTNYLGSKKYIDESDMRSILTPLANLAAELGIVVVTVGHFNRREKGTDPIHRFLGANAFIGVARAVYAFGPDPEEESKFAHVMTVVRACGGEGSALRYHTEIVTESGDGNAPNEIIRVVWDGCSNATAEDSVDPSPSKESHKRKKPPKC